MHILITGAAGMIGQKLLDRIARDGALGGRAIARATLHDVTSPAVPARSPFPCTTIVSDFAAEGEAERLIADRPDVIFHLAAVVSSDAEENFDKGYRVNLDGTRRLLETIRAQSSFAPRFIYASGGAVYGTPLPDVIDDEFLIAPLSSYGTQKAICELLLADYTRRGFIDGIGLRLPTICVRPGRPNRAASSFFSGIIREPLNGEEAILPVPDTIRHWMTSPRSAIGFLIRAATMDLSTLGHRRSLNMPGASVTVAEQIEALRRAAGTQAVALIRHEPDERVLRIVNSWPRGFATSRAHDAGFRAEASFDEILRAYIEDDMNSRPPGGGA